MNDLAINALVKDNIKDIIPDMSFYNNGFKYFEFEDNNDHLNETAFNFVDLKDTPEKIITYLAGKAKVIGISATSTIKIVTGNYDLDYLKSKLQDKFKYISTESYKKIEEDLENIWEAYNSGEIKINTAILNLNKDHLPMEERLKEIFIERSLVRKYTNSLSIFAAEEDFIWKRYCNVFSAIKEFVIHDDIKSFLCLNTVLPKVQGNVNTFSLELFENALTDLVKYYDKNREVYNIVVLRSENFDEDKKEILNKLRKNEKVFIMSSYKTTGAGQNLQYPVNNIEDFITIGNDEVKDDPRYSKKDIDDEDIVEYEERFFKSDDNMRLKASELGSAVHDVLEGFAGELLNLNSIGDLDLRKYIENFNKIEGKNKEEKVLKNSKLLYSANEIPFTYVLEENRNITVRGFIDRVDVYEQDGIIKAEVIDYKTNKIKSNNDINSIEEHYKPQLLLYGKVVEELMKINNGIIESIVPKLYLLSNGKIVKYEYDDLAVETLFAEINRVFSNDFSAMNIDEFYKVRCKYCSSCKLCDELT